MQDHRVARHHIRHAGADVPHPPGVLVAECVRQPHVGLLRPLAFDDVQVGATQPRPAHLDDHVHGPDNAWFGYVVEHGLLVIGVEPDGLHRRPPAHGCPYRPPANVVPRWWQRKGPVDLSSPAWRAVDVAVADGFDELGVVALVLMGVGGSGPHHRRAEHLALGRGRRRWPRRHPSWHGRGRGPGRT
jgi:hypothetical protein